MVWQVVWHDTRISDAPACSDYVFASKAPHLAGDIAFEGDVVVVLESERQRRTETVGVDDSLSHVLITTAVSVLTDESGSRMPLRRERHLEEQRQRPRKRVGRFSSRVL